MIIGHMRFANARVWRAWVQKGGSLFDTRHLQRKLRLDADSATNRTRRYARLVMGARFNTVSFVASKDASPRRRQSCRPKEMLDL